MKTFPATTILAALLSCAAPLYAQLSIPEMPPDEQSSTQYKLFVDGRPVPVWTASCDKAHLGKTYSFAYFDISRPADIRIVPAEPFTEAVIRPLNFQIRPEIENKEIRFRIDRPRKISVEPYGMKNTLFLFANTPESQIPDKNDPNVIFLDPGVHNVPGDVLRLTSNQTLYLAPGAVLKAAVQVKNAENITIKGRGIIDGSQWPWLKGPAGTLLGFEKCKNIDIEGIILKGSYAWTLVPRRCENVTITDVKIVGDRVQNDDGINPCNSRNVTVRDCFIRTDDDCMSIKGLRGGLREPSEDITIENMTFWCSRARIILFAHESQAEAMRRIRIADSRIIHYTMTPFLLEPGEEMPLTDIIIEGININAVGKGEIARLRPVVNQYMVLKTPGRIENVTFKNIDIDSDNPQTVFFHLEGADEKHDVKNITFRNIKINNEEVKDLEKHLRIKDHVSQVSR